MPKPVRWWRLNTGTARYQSLFGGLLIAIGLLSSENWTQSQFPHVIVDRVVPKRGNGRPSR